LGVLSKYTKKSTDDYQILLDKSDQYILKILNSLFAVF